MSEHPVDKALRDLEAAVRADAVSKIEEELEAICQNGHNNQRSPRDASYFVESLLKRNVDRSVIVWLALLMLTDIAQRGWLSVGCTQWTSTEDDPTAFESGDEVVRRTDIEFDAIGGGIAVCISSIPAFDLRLFFNEGDAEAMAAIYVQEGM
jgi:hypothetical protein